MHKGSCHCGATKFEVEGDFTDALECNCSYCSNKGTLLWFVPRSALTVTGEESLSTYRFNKHVIEHKFCSKCGSTPFGFGKMPDGTATAAINVRCLNDVDISQVKRVPFNGRDK